MLLFIGGSESSQSGCTKFQNIVCYCLSTQGTEYAGRHRPFQNIVCYCLSRPSGERRNYIYISKHRMLLFIQALSFQDIEQINFKTSYVTVYRNFCGLCLVIRVNFKTSYVTVYHECWKESPSFYVISKHRMLLFIPHLSCLLIF